MSPGHRPTVQSGQRDRSLFQRRPDRRRRRVRGAPARFRGPPELSAIRRAEVLATSRPFSKTASRATSSKSYPNKGAQLPCEDVGLVTDTTTAPHIVAGRNKVSHRAVRPDRGVPYGHETKKPSESASLPTAAIRSIAARGMRIERPSLTAGTPVRPRLASHKLANSYSAEAEICKIGAASLTRRKADLVDCTTAPPNVNSQRSDYITGNCSAEEHKTGTQWLT